MISVTHSDRWHPKNFVPDLVDLFYKSGGTELNYVEAFNQACEGFRNNLFWTFWKVDPVTPELIGYACGAIQKSEAHERVLVVQQMYVLPGITPKQSKLVFFLFQKMLDRECDKREITQMGFYTRRHPLAFLRRMPAGWRLDSYVLTRRAHCESREEKSQKKSHKALRELRVESLEDAREKDSLRVSRMQKNA